MEAPKLGEAAPASSARDAVHVAVVAVDAGEDMAAGDRVGLGGDGRAYNAHAHGIKYLGIVDPFLLRPVREGQRFWLCVHPGTATSIRHVWTHPDFDAFNRKRLEEILSRELR